MRTFVAERKPQTQATEIHTCRECGKTGTDMVGNYYYIGGQGDVLLYDCQDCLDTRRETSRKACEALRKVVMLGK